MSARLPINLMLVEDERIVAFDLKRQLQGFGYTVTSVVASGEQAISQIAADKPDLVLMDIHLEGQMDGIEAAIQIRSRHRTPVIFLTAYAEDDTLRRALDSRPFGYLVKPCEGRELHATIQMAIARREDEVAVEQSEARLQLALDAGSLGVLEWDPTTNRMLGDNHLGKLFGDPSLSLDESWEDFISRIDPADRECVSLALTTTLMIHESVKVEFRTIGNHIPPHHVEVYAQAYGREGKMERVVGILRDVTQRHKDDERLRQSSVVFHATAEAIVITDSLRRIIAVNTAFTRITGYPESEVIGLDPEILLCISPGPERFSDCLEPDAPGFWHGEINCRRMNGQAFPAWQSISTVRNRAGAITHIVTAFSDVTAIYEAQKKLHHLAHHDPLTGLPNRVLFNDRLETAIERATRDVERCLLLFLDLDGFKVINDTLGHAVGDQLLSHVGERLKNVLRSSDTVARLGGDEFVILAGSTNPDYAAQMAQKILEQLRLPIIVAGQAISISGSLGIAVFPDNGTDAQQLMRAADMAMYTAKGNGRNRYHFYTENMSAWASERLDVEQGLRRGIANDELIVHYQPRVNLAGHQIVGVEALVRWHHPERGLIMPGGFISIAEESDLIEELGRWVLHRACTEMLDIVTSKSHGEKFNVAVNVSARQFHNSDFVSVVQSVLAETGFPAAALELEITESTLQATERSLITLNALEKLGVAISIDDFGTGYSSLSVLRDLPIKRIKIDRSFIVDMPANDGQRAVVEAIVSLSRAMNMAITVEGIERQDQAELLQEMGCQEGQGYLFSQPLPLDKITTLFKR